MAIKPKGDNMVMCVVEGCDRLGQCSANGDWVCLMHYKRWVRHGSALVTKQRYGAPNPNKRVCAVDGCWDLEDGAAGMCKLHDTRRRRHGDPTVVIRHRDRNFPRGSDNHNWSGDSATYSAVHQRLRKTRGPASKSVCVDCGEAAAQWSYDRSCPRERSAPEGPYSVDLDRYVPRCVPCHKMFDLAAHARG